jgi:excisionase family DNA binding protein
MTATDNSIQALLAVKASDLLNQRSCYIEQLSLDVAGPLIDAKGAGALLGVPASWVLAQARDDRIPHVRLGRYVRFDPAELDSWWRARARGPANRS